MFFLLLNVLRESQSDMKCVNLLFIKIIFLFSSCFFVIFKNVFESICMVIKEVELNEHINSGFELCICYSVYKFSSPKCLWHFFVSLEQYRADTLNLCIEFLLTKCHLIFKSNIIIIYYSILLLQ